MAEFKGKFTDLYLKALKAEVSKNPPAREYDLREGHGFGIRVRKTGIITFFYIYHFDGKRKFLNLGIYGLPPDISLSEARQKHAAAFSQVRSGVDPLGQKKAAAEEKAIKAKKAVQQAEAEACAVAHLEKYTFETLLKEGIPEDFVPTTVEQLAGVWFINYSKENHTERWQETAVSCIRNHIVPGIGQMEIAAVRHKHAVSLIQRIAVTVPGSARNAMKFARQMFKYACRQEWADIQPFTEITESVPKIAPKADDRHLDDDEIVKAWDEISRSSSSRDIKRALKLILVTAQRPGEVAQMHRDQIKGRWWTIPSTVAGKNEREHRVYLTNTALELIGDGKGYIFPAKRGKQGHISANALSQAINRSYLRDSSVKVVGDRKIKARKEPYFGMKPWSPHDLRRTARTNMARVGVSDEVGEEVVNHIKPGVVGVYNKYRYDNEKKEALIKWETLLLEILKNKPVAMEEDLSEVV